MQTLQKRLEIWGQNERHQGGAGGAAKCGFVYSEAERWDVLLTNIYLQKKVMSAVRM